MDEEGVLDFLTSLEAMDLPDRIEEVNSKILAKIIDDTPYVAVLFCEYFVRFLKYIGEYLLAVTLRLSLGKYLICCLKLIDSLESHAKKSLQFKKHLLFYIKVFMRNWNKFEKIKIQTYNL